MEKNITIDEKLSFIKNAILKYVPAKSIYLFGSYAYGTPTEDSDIDIYAVTPDEVELDPALYGRIKREVWNMNIKDGLDLTLKSESKFNYRKTQSLFEGIICERGKLLYECN